MLLVGLGLADIRQRVSAVEAMSSLTDTVLEVRRYEKNWLLYRQEQNFHENQIHNDAALALLRKENRDEGGAAFFIRLPLNLAALK